METTRKIPVGLKVLRILTIIFGAFGLFGLIGTIVILCIAGTKIGIPVNVGANITAIIYTAFEVAYSVIIIIAISRPSTAKFNTVCVFMGIDTLASIVCLFIGYQSITANIVSILLNLITLWYFFKVKTYFTTGSIDTNAPSVKKANTIFLFGFVGVIVLSFIVSMVMGAFLLKNSIQRLGQFEGKTVEQNMAYCRTLSGEAHDTCIIDLLGIASKENQPANPSFCSEMNTTDKNRLAACYTLVQRCDYITDADMQKSCVQTVQLLHSLTASSTYTRGGILKK